MVLFYFLESTNKCNFSNDTAFNPVVPGVR